MRHPGKEQAGSIHTAGVGERAELGPQMVALSEWEGKKGQQCGYNAESNSFHLCGASCRSHPGFGSLSDLGEGWVDTPVARLRPAPEF